MDLKFFEINFWATIFYQKNSKLQFLTRKNSKAEIVQKLKTPNPQGKKGSRSEIAEETFSRSNIFYQKNFGPRKKNIFA